MKDYHGVSEAFQQDSSFSDKFLEKIHSGSDLFIISFHLLRVCGVSVENLAGDRHSSHSTRIGY